MSAARLILLPWLILAAALGTTWLVWDHERQATRKELRSQFDFSLREAVSRVEQRMSAYEQILRGVQGLFATTGMMDRHAFRNYVGSLQLDANFSGIQAIGVAEHVPAARRVTHVAAMRQSGIRDYAIQPEGLRESYAPVTQREPYVDRNRVVLGFDAWTDSVRRLAMELARDSGMAAISGKVRLAADNEADAPPGFIMYLPLYARGQPHDSVSQRRANLVGWVFAAFRMKDLMASLYGEQAPGLAFAIYDGVELSDAMLLYRSAEAGNRRHPAAFAANEYLVVAGHTWTLSMSTLDDFEARFGRDAAPLIAGAGTGLSLLLALLAWLMATGRARALRLAAEMTRELRESEEKFRAIANCTVNWEVWWGLDGKPRWINPSVKDYTGYTVEECMAMPDFAGTLFYSEDMPRVAPEIRKGLQGLSGNDFEFRCVRKDGSLFWLSVSWVPIHDAKGVFSGFRTSGRDITERKQLEDEVRQLAFHDALTKLPNRRLLDDRLSQTMAAGKRSGCCGALMFLDLDNFKSLNDSHGHEAGDLLLIEAADRLKNCVREMDTVARFGGDEFVVMISELAADKAESTSQAEIVAEKLRAELGKPYMLKMQHEGKAETIVEHHCTVSIGVAMFSMGETSQDNILKWADTAMYRAKEAGSNLIRFYDSKA